MPQQKATRVLLLDMGEPSAEMLRYVAEQYGPNVEVSRIEPVLTKINDFSDLIQSQRQDTMVYIGLHYTMPMATLLRPAEENRAYGFFERHDGEVNVYHIHYLHLDFVWSSKYGIMNRQKVSR